jgi:predicted ABC-type ATPase
MKTWLAFCSGPKAVDTAPRNEKSERSHEASLANLRAAIDAFERVDIYDSTALWSTPQLVATSHDGRVDRLSNVPSWLESVLSNLEA